MAGKWIVLVVASLMLGSCGGGGSASPPLTIVAPQPEVQGLLIPLTSNAELENYMRESFSQAASNSNRLLENTLVADAQPSASGFTTTYTLEASVDEHDAVKYNGEHLFIAPSRSMDCCFIVDDIAIAEPDNSDAAMPEAPAERSIRILSTDPLQGTANQVASIPLTHDRRVEGLYSSDSQLVSISSSAWYGSYGQRFADPSVWQGQTTALHLYDISDIAAPTEQLSVEFQGGIVNSRKKGDMVYLVARHTPSIDNYSYYPNDAQQISNQDALDALSIEQILPQLRINGEISEFISAEDCRVSDSSNDIAPQGVNDPTLTLIIAIDLAQQSVAKTTCYLEPTSGIYVSNNRIYLAQDDYTGSQYSTLVHSYSLSAELNYLGSGAVPGQLGLAGNRDFRINEHNGYLRLVTTSYNNNTADSVDHQLFILQLSTDAPQLETVATLPNNARPQPIGKPNEDLYGVRFMGDLLYLVTFERIDPLYVIDLADPSDPFIAGELTVTGFSDFLHPVGDELLLGLGQDEEGLVKLELFNIANINAPYSLGAQSIEAGASWSYSEARYNRHAFTYQSINNITDRFSVPVSIGFNNEVNGYSEQDRLYLFEINGKDNAANASVDRVGSINVDADSWWSNRQRAVFHDDAVFFINADSVWSTLWTDSSQQNGPY
jgi:uncharacterized secreted protein with C-terminal beta-propeller domain